MQSIFRLPWCSEHIAPKMSDNAALEKMRATPVVEIPVLNKLKRRNTDNTDAQAPTRASPNKKPRNEDTNAPTVPPVNTRLPTTTGTEHVFAISSETPSVTHSSAEAKSGEAMLSNAASTTSTHGLDSTAPSAAEKRMDSAIEMKDVSDSAMGQTDSTSLQEVIESEFNMQILMKHNELRLIEQELAKCQIALEQLRRCELQPFPGGDEVSAAVSAGTGPSILPPAGYSQPSHPSPYGIADGPYSRHYSQWLLRDPQFDSMSVQASFHADAYAHAAGRSTRNSGSARKSISKPFAFPGRPGDTLQSIPNYPAPAPKDKSAPLVLRRSTDNQLVKLICNNCLRGNFSSIQGFLNHCRIAHKVDYKSHDAAAIDCGRVLEEHELANLPPETQSTPAPKPSVSRASTTTTTPYRNLVHPFNTAAGASIATSNSAQKASTVPRIPVRKFTSGLPSSSNNDSPLTPSVQLPRLSAHFAKHQLGGDLSKAVADAKQRADLGVDDDVSSPDISEQNSPLEAADHGIVSGRAGLMSIPGTAAGGRPSSQKGFKSTAQQRPRPSPLAPASHHSVSGGMKPEQHGGEIPESPQFHGQPNLSPHGADSNPGLVSDHEDEDDHGSASEEDETAPQPQRRPAFAVAPGSRNCADNMDMPVDVVEDAHLGDDGARVIIRNGSLFSDDERGIQHRAQKGSPSRKLGKRK